MFYEIREGKIIDLRGLIITREEDKVYFETVNGELTTIITPINIETYWQDLKLALRNAK